MASAVVATERARPDNSRALVWGLLAVGVTADLIGIVGSTWDGAYHRRYVVDTFFSPPHILIYSGMLCTLLVGLVILGIVLAEAREESDIGAALLRRPLLLVVVLANLGFLATGPFDALWHSMFGRDTLTPWTVPHAILALNMMMVAFGVTGLALWLRAPHPAAGIAPPATQAARRLANVPLFIAVGLVSAHLWSFVIEWEKGRSFGSPAFQFGWVYPPLAVFIAALVLTLIAGAFSGRWWLIPLITLTARLFQVVPSLVVASFGYPRTSGWLLMLTGAAVVYALLTRIGRDWPAWVRYALFGAGYIGIICAARAADSLPTLTTTDVLITAPLLPPLAVLGGTLGARVFRLLQRLAGES